MNKLGGDASIFPKVICETEANIKCEKQEEEMKKKKEDTATHDKRSELSISSLIGGDMKKQKRKRKKPTRYDDEDDKDQASLPTVTSETKNNEMKRNYQEAFNVEDYGTIIDKVSRKSVLERGICLQFFILMIAALIKNDYCSYVS